MGPKDNCLRPQTQRSVQSVVDYQREFSVADSIEVITDFSGCYLQALNCGQVVRMHCQAEEESAKETALTGAREGRDAVQSTTTR